MILVTGSASSGKSAFAERLLLRFGESKRIYVATMIPWDQECRDRILRHRRQRGGKGFETVECHTDLDRLAVPEGSAVLLECMSNLTANEMYRPDRVEAQTDDFSVEKLADRIARGVARLHEAAGELVVVTNEVFSDGITYPDETVRYQRVMGELNRRMAAMADQVYEVVCGIPVAVKG